MALPTVLDSKRAAALTAAALVGLLVAEVVIRLPMYGEVWIGHDYRTYMAAARDWLANGQFYEPYQFTPYDIHALEILYPPVVLWLLVPFLVLPAVLWWAIPVAIVAYVLWRQKPSPWQWVTILALLVFPIDKATSWAVEFVGNGNPGIWVGAIVALATRWPFFGSWALMKPSLAPFALVGVNKSAWWAGAAALAALCLPFGLMWLDYARVLLNAQNGGILYSLPNVTLCLVPLVVPLLRFRRPERDVERRLDDRERRRPFAPALANGDGLDVG